MTNTLRFIIKYNGHFCEVGHQRRGILGAAREGQPAHQRRVLQQLQERPHTQVTQVPQ